MIMSTHVREVQQSPGLLSTLLQRDFALLWIGGFVSYLGTWSMFIALPLYVYNTSGSALATTTVFTVTVVPRLFGSVAGVLVDRWDRRRTLMIASLIMAVCTLPLLAAPSGRLWLIYATMFALSVAGLVVSPAENALLPQLVGRERLIAANSLNSLNDNLGRIVGPAVGGLILALGGFASVVIFNVITFVIAAVVIGLIRTRGPMVPDREAGTVGPVAGTPSGWAEWRAGLAAVRRSTVVMIVLVAAATGLLGDSILSSLLAPFVAETLSSGGAVLGLFLTIRGIGGVVGGIVAGQASRWLSPGQMIAISLIVLGGALAVIVALPHVPVALVAAALLGICVVCWMANQHTIIQTNTEDGFLGRTYGVLGTVTAITLIIGSGLAGALADRIGIPFLMYGAAGCYVAAGVIALRLHYGRSDTH